MSTKILQETLKAGPSAIIDLYEADFSSIGESDLLRFFNGTNTLTTNITWQGNEYTSFPIAITGFEWDGSGRLPTPKMVGANVSGFLTALNMQYGDLLGVKITRRRTFLRFLDTINFENGTNPEADPTAEFPKEIYYIDRKVAENSIAVEYELASALDLSTSKLPRRIIAQNICMWKYRGGECGYTGTLYLDSFGNPTTEALDRCGKRLSDCEKRFYSIGIKALNFGGFPGSGLMR